MSGEQILFNNLAIYNGKSHKKPSTSVESGTRSAIDGLVPDPPSVLFAGVGITSKRTKKGHIMYLCDLCGDWRGERINCHFVRRHGMTESGQYPVIVR